MELLTDVKSQKPVPKNNYWPHDTKRRRGFTPARKQVSQMKLGSIHNGSYGINNLKQIYWTNSDFFAYYEA